MLRLGREREVVQVVADQYGCPTYAADLAETILRVAAQVLEGRQVHWGTYHYCGKGVTSWHGFAGAILNLAKEHIQLKVKRIEPITTAEYPTQAKRPVNSALDCSLFESRFGLASIPWNESLTRMLHKVLSKEINPH
jgi:dTDP-4-dehydrorhamnose reductase